MKPLHANVTTFTRNKKGWTAVRATLFQNRSLARTPRLHRVCGVFHGVCRIFHSVGSIVHRDSGVINNVFYNVGSVSGFVSRLFTAGSKSHQASCCESNCEFVHCIGSHSKNARWKFFHPTRDTGISVVGAQVKFFCIGETKERRVEAFVYQIRRNCASAVLASVAIEKGITDRP